MKPKIIVASISVLTSIVIATSSRADHISIKEMIAYVPDPPNHSTAFFLGDHGYLLTVLPDPATATIRKSLNIVLKAKDGNPTKYVAAIINVDQKTGIALLRLAKVRYPFQHALITTEKTGDLYNTISTQDKLTIYYGKPGSPYVDEEFVTITDLEPDDAGLKFKFVNNAAFLDSMTGAPVFFRDLLIGIVGKHAIIHPINHASQFVAIAEGTVLGKGMIQRLVETMAKKGSLLSEQDQLAWKNFLDAVAVVQLLTPVSAEIQPRQDLKNVFDLRVKIQPLVNIMKNPSRIFITAYPQSVYELPSERRLISWSESRAKADEFGDIAFRHTFEAPIADMEKKQTIDFVQMKAAIAKAFKLDPAQSSQLKITGLMVYWQWQIQGADGKTMTHRNEAYFPVKEP